MGNDKRSEDFHAVEFKIFGEDIGRFCINFEWISFVNCGHRFYGSFYDAHGNSFEKEFVQKILDKSKTEDGLDVEVRIWQRFDKKRGKKTKVRKLKVLTLSSSVPGGLTTPVFSFVCIDAASWMLNKGKCSGKAYKGKISDAIKQIAEEHTNGITIDVEQTKDNENNMWWDMKLDPKTVINSLIEWSSKITPKESPFVVQSQDDKFICKEWYSLEPITTGKKFLVLKEKGDEKEINNHCTMQILNNNLLSPAATRLYTSSISATSGFYIDKGNAKEKEYFVDDEFTQVKLGPSIKRDQGYKKSSAEYGTFIHAIPEHNNGDIGIKYQDYAIGRARDWFIRTIYTTMRIKVTIEPGDTDFDDVRSCGRDKIILEAYDIEAIPYYIDGPWLLYGFKHYGVGGTSSSGGVFTPTPIGNWQTELHLSRIDYDAVQKDI